MTDLLSSYPIHSFLTYSKFSTIVYNDHIQTEWSFAKATKWNQKNPSSGNNSYSRNY